MPSLPRVMERAGRSGRAARLSKTNKQNLYSSNLVCFQFVGLSEGLYVVSKFPGCLANFFYIFLPGYSWDGPGMFVLIMWRTSQPMEYVGIHRLSLLMELDMKQVFNQTALPSHL